MKKFNPTAEGLKAFQAELAGYKQDALLEEAALAARDGIAYLCNRLELDVFTVEALRSLDEVAARQTGWLIALALSKGNIVAAGPSEGIQELCLNGLEVVLRWWLCLETLPKQAEL